MSRFRPDSELSQLNRAGALEVSADLAHVIELALAAREQTAGRFDPCVHDALVAAGYDRTFAEVAPDGADTAQVAPICGGRRHRSTAAASSSKTARSSISGGIGKGYAAERAADILAAAGPCLVDAGGDIAVRGGHAWPVGVETGDGVVTLALERGALATSGSDRRRWIRGGEERHHLIDPRTGRSAASDVLRVTAFADDAVAGGGAREAPLPRRRGGGGGERRDRDRRHPQRRDDPHGRLRVRHDPTFWLLARASGMTAYVLVTLSVLAGLVAEVATVRAPSAGDASRRSTARSR